MKNFNTVEEILDFAISEEIGAYKFYTDLAAKVDKVWVKKILEDFAKEELGHRAKLEAVKRGHTFVPSEKAVMDLKIGDYLVDVDPNQYKVLDYQQALIIAMKKEKSAFKLYSDLSTKTDNEDLQELFKALAQEEAKHKLRFELEYDDIILNEN